MDCKPGNGSFEHFADQYCPPIFFSVSKLTGLDSENELELLTANILVHLWEEKEALANEGRPGVFIYKIVLQHVFTHLKEMGNTDRISLLRNGLLIDPAHYSHILEPGKKSFTNTLGRKIRRIWKTL
jgi:hypothetical protein